MATDSFTNTNGTALSVHTAGGNTWSGAGAGASSGAIVSNVACADADEFFSVTGRATNSSVGFSQIVFKAGAYISESKAVHVRSSAANAGYWLQAYTVAGGNITVFALLRHDAFLTTVEGVSIPTGSDHTVALKATTVGSDVQIQAWVDGSPLTFLHTDNDTETPSTTFTDLAAYTPITAAGNPGFSCAFFDGIGPTNSGFDDWTDVEPSEEEELEITSISDATLTHGQAGVVVDVAGYAASGKTVKVCPTDNVDDLAGVLQTVTAQDGDSITFTAVLNSFAFGSTLYLFVIDDDDAANEVGEPISRIVASATLTVTMRDKTNALVTSQSSITLKIWRADTPSGAYSQEITGLSTNGSGVLSTTITLGSLDGDDYVCWFAYRGSPASQFSAGRNLPTYA